NMAICTGPLDIVTMGSMKVFIGGKPAARMGDSCAHGGTIITGSPIVLLG
ncbi:PAAR domain-containing protein, partial [Escherichia coli]|nr:PAAR domain-containing protein [Escherichia coli]